MPARKTIKRFLANNGLSLLMFALFGLFLLGLSITGHREQNDTLQSHNQPTQSYWGYVASGDFVEAVFENWESEFLQMAGLVIATIYLRQKGSADSKKITGANAVDTSSRYSIIRASSWRTRRRAVERALYANSLGIALLALFVLSFIFHALGGVEAQNEEAMLHGETTQSLWQYVRSAQFWFESFQNWQSEFLAVGTLLVLSIFLRQRGSPESKPIGESNQRTGG